MNITTIAEHSVCLDLLPPKAIILDVGCRGFEFTNHLRNLSHKVYPIDIDYLDSGDYYQYAISDNNGFCSVSKDPDPQSRHIIQGNDIKCITLAEFKRRQGIQHIDLLKLDIEGEEVPVLESLSHPFCKQISVEFHLHVYPKTISRVESLLDNLSNYYDIYNRKYEPRHGAGFNYWDVLLIAK